MKAVYGLAGDGNVLRAPFPFVTDDEAAPIFDLLVAVLGLSVRDLSLRTPIAGGSC